MEKEVEGGMIVEIVIKYKCGVKESDLSALINKLNSYDCVESVSIIKDQSEIDRLKHENEKLRQNQAKLVEALKPFAEHSEDIYYGWSSDLQKYLQIASKTMKEVCNE